MEIILKKIFDLKQDSNNPRKEIDEEEIEALAEGIKIQGLMHPIEIDETNTIIDGHRRYLACKKAGLKEIPCIQKSVSKEMNKDKYFRLKRQLQANLTGRNLQIKDAKEQIVELAHVCNLSHNKLAKELGIARQHLERILAVADKGSPALIKAVESKQIEDTLVASQIASLPKATQELVTEKIIKDDLGRAKAQELITDVKNLPEESVLDWIDQADAINESAAEIKTALINATIAGKKEYPYDEEKAKKITNLDFQSLILKQINSKDIFCPRHKAGRLIWSCCKEEVGLNV